MLVFPLDQIPQLARGKGSKLMQIPSAKAKSHEEYVIDMQVMPASAQTITIYAGKRHFVLKRADVVHYQGDRGTRGKRLPRGLQTVTSIVIA
jgi:topoisomerase-4 subunit A